MKWPCPLSEATCVIAEVCGDRSIPTFYVFPNRLRGRPTVGPFEIDHIINPSAVHQKLSQSQVFPTFHVSWVKTVTDLDLLPLSEPPPPLAINGSAAYTVRHILDVRGWRGLQFQEDWREGGGVHYGGADLGSPALTVSPKENRSFHHIITCVLMYNIGDTVVIVRNRVLVFHTYASLSLWFGFFSYILHQGEILHRMTWVWHSNYCDGELCLDVSTMFVSELKKSLG